MLDVEHALVRAYGWSLYEIDNTDAENLLMFLFHDPDNRPRPQKRAYCDQVTWL